MGNLASIYRPSETFSVDICIQNIRTSENELLV